MNSLSKILRAAVCACIILNSQFSILNSASAQGIAGGHVTGNIQLDGQISHADSIIGSSDVAEKLLMNARADILYTNGNFNAGLRFEMYQNPMLGFDSRYKGQGLANYFVSYQGERLSVTAGTFYEQFGSGMILRLYEDRYLGIDNALLGMNVTLRPVDGITVKALAGKQRKSRVISPREKEIIAYHEVGHALVAARQKGAAPVHKITIIPRTSGALGFTMQADEDERFLMDKQEAFAKIVTLTGGRAAEEIRFDSVTTGASNDIEQATSIARAMITRYGMSESFGMTAFEQVVNPYLGTDTAMNCSQETAARIDREVIALIDKAYDQARTILRDNRSKLDEIARVLIARETISGQEFMDILNAPVALPAKQEVEE